MNFHVADLPAVRAQLERDAATLQLAPADDAAPQYARAPAAPGPQSTGVRPPAIQGGTR